MIVLTGGADDCYVYNSLTPDGEQNRRSFIAAANMPAFEVRAISDNAKPVNTLASNYYSIFTGSSYIFRNIAAMHSYVLVAL